jgi:hypothetical protein
MRGLVARRWYSDGGTPTSSQNRGAERAQAGEPDQQAHLGDGQVGVAQQVLGPLDAPAGEVPAGRVAVGGAERADEGYRE